MSQLERGRIIAPAIRTFTTSTIGEGHAEPSSITASAHLCQTGTRHPTDSCRNLEILLHGQYRYGLAGSLSAAVSHGHPAAYANAGTQPIGKPSSLKAHRWEVNSKLQSAR